LEPQETPKVKIGVAAGPEATMIEDARRVSDLLRGATLEIETEEKLAHDLGVAGTPLKKLDVDLLLVIGSDRTLLNTLLKLGKREIPILPVASMGQPDFLFDVTVSNLQSIVGDLLKRRWTEDRRTRLEVKLNGLESPPVLNELAVFARTSATLIRYSLLLDGELVWKDSSDGLLIATPTGSTAYSMSVGGPVVLRTAPVFSVVPVNSANPARKALIVSDKTVIGVQGITSGVTVEAVLDGQIRRPIEGASIEVSRSDYDAVFVKLTAERVAALQGKLQRRTEALETIAHELPPSAKLVLKVLEYHEQMTQREIIDETKLPARTVRHAMAILISEGLVTKRLSLRDSRQGLFCVAKPGASRSTGTDRVGPDT